MMDPEDIQTDLHALQKLYQLLEKDGQYSQNAGAGNLDTKARLLLKNLLDSAAEKTFEAHAKILAAQFSTSCTQLSIQQVQSRDALKPQPLFLRDSSTNPASAVQSTFQGVSSGQSKSISTCESEIRTKRCRICQRPRLIKDIKIPGTEASTSDKVIFSASETHKHKRSWDVRNDQSGVKGSVCSLNNPLTMDFGKFNSPDEEDPISREASAKIQQTESRISASQVAAKYVDLLESDSTSKLSQTGKFSVGRSDPKSSTTSRRVWKPSHSAHHWHDQTLNQLRS